MNDTMTIRSDPPASPQRDLAAVDFVAIDVETACARVSSICQIGIVGFRDGAEVFAYESLVDPRDAFSPANTRIHGIGSDHIVGKPTFPDLHATVDGHLSGRVSVAHSLFDKGALAAACRMHGVPSVETSWLDSVRVARRAWPDLPSHRLNALARFLGLRHKHHDALSDARAAAMVIVRAIDQTGITLADWLKPAHPRGGSAPQAAALGPLRGQRIALLGSPRDGPLARRLAELGARIVASVGTGSTMLVIGDDQPFGRFVHGHAAHRRAVELQGAGSGIEIVSEDDLLARHAAG